LLTTMPGVRDKASLSDMNLAPFSVYIGEATKPARSSNAGN
jgi:hypothetical protein